MRAAVAVDCSVSGDNPEGEHHCGVLVKSAHSAVSVRSHRTTIIIGGAH